jgi:hypothetical protein
MIIKVLQPSESQRHKLCRCVGYLLYQKYCEKEHSTAAKLPHLADNLAFKNLKAECMVDYFGLPNL